MARITKLLRNPVAQFLATGLLTLAVLLVGTAVLNTNAAREKALQDAQGYTQLLAHSVAEPVIPYSLVRGDLGAADRFDPFAREFLKVGGVRRLKIWNQNGKIVYSDEPRLIGKTFKLGEEELKILHSRHGGTDAEPTDLRRPENQFEPNVEMVEVYTQVHARDRLGNRTEGPPLLFEAYFSVAGIEKQQAAMIAPFRSITLGALGILVAVATALLWVLTRRVTRAAAERERLLRSAASASDAERRRIARDLHDGVVQDLAGTTFALSAMAREASEPEQAVLLENCDSLRGSLRGLRSLLVEIHPPDLSADSLPAALQDLIAPAEATGVRATVDVTGGRAATGDTVALVWRVAQEAVRNTLRHARAAALSVVVRDQGDRVVLEVTDDGVGFDPAAVRTDVHYGLRGLDSLVRDSGGTLLVRSAPGTGTTIRLETGA
jgi:signal transduction histidine kinase